MTSLATAASRHHQKEVNQVYNLLIQLDSAHSAWSKSQRFQLHGERVFEYTDDRVRSMFDKDIQALKELPCLFSYEGLYGSGRVGRITSIKKPGAAVEIVYALDGRFPPIHIHDEETYELFGCAGWERNRTHWAVKDVDLFEVVAELFAKQSEQTGQSVSEEAAVRLWGDHSGAHCRVFLSHRAKDKSLAAKVAKKLEKLGGHRTFVAHKDIQPTREWRDEIVHALNTMTHFVALITNEFHDGGWTDQEIGYAFCRKDVKRVFVKLSGTDPKGLAAFEQAVPGGSNIAEHIHEVITENR